MKNNYLQPFPFVFKKIGKYLSIVSIALFVFYLAYLLISEYDMFSLESFSKNGYYILFKITLIVSLCFILFSDEKQKDERLIQIRLVQFKVIAYIFTFWVLEQQLFMLSSGINPIILFFIQDPAIILILGMAISFVDFHFLKKEL